MKRLILLLSFIAGSIHAQTNWPMFRQVQGQVYNVQLSQKWRVVSPVAGHMKDSFKVKPGDRVTVMCSVAGVPGAAEIRNVPYNPAEWDFPKNKEAVTKANLIWKVLAVGDGDRGQKVYDYGVPVGTKEK